jgi:hypothetical protein
MPRNRPSFAELTSQLGQLHASASAQGDGSGADDKPASNQMSVAVSVDMSGTVCGNDYEYEMPTLPPVSEPNNVVDRGDDDVADGSGYEIPNAALYSEPDSNVAASETAYIDVADKGDDNVTFGFDGHE